MLTATIVLLSLHSLLVEPFIIGMSAKMRVVEPLLARHLTTYPWWQNNWLQFVLKLNLGQHQTPIRTIKLIYLDGMTRIVDIEAILLDNSTYRQIKQIVCLTLC